MRFIPYNKNLKEFSRELRSHSTLSEVLLWQKLRARQFRGYAFNRQKPLGDYIVDFYCKRLQLVIEIDGDSHFHDESVLEDLKRQLVLEKMGLCFLRFLDGDVKKSMPSILQEIGVFIDKWEVENGVPKTIF
ncbi:endonuclease domain-containing protein [Cyclobacterium jeungdonense]|uniref:Endonuclease domain-containing protein n=1 Tax=Cyclobacterium jeungdonense TaxID=708087 RepID=A0ABT8CEM5_9BACT|nr:endonuclease domain-containing protein [Cyclobacterium jeungdonense]MDN3690043.1 endonuclease domain-containing protein [Cyclobacterium jeungdonense]